MKLFKPEDFKTTILFLTTIEERETAAEIANKIFQKWLDAAPSVYGRHMSMENYMKWTDTPSVLNTHSAKLVCIEEIKKECTEHEAVNICIEGTLVRAVCKYCGVELKAKWEAVK